MASEIDSYLDEVADSPPNEIPGHDFDDALQSMAPSNKPARPKRKKKGKVLPCSPTEKPPEILVTKASLPEHAILADDVDSSSTPESFPVTNAFSTDFSDSPEVSPASIPVGSSEFHSINLSSATDHHLAFSSAGEAGLIQRDNENYIYRWGHNSAAHISWVKWSYEVSFCSLG